MSWYYNKNTGEIFEATGWQKWLVDREVDLEKAAAAAVPPQVGAVSGLAGVVTAQVYFGPFATKEDAQKFAGQHPSVASQAKQAVNTISDIPSAIANATKTAAQIYLRSAEIAVGVVLLAVALNAILKQTTGVDAIGTAKTVGKRAAVVAAV